MFEGWNVVHHPHKASGADRLDTWWLGLPKKRCVTLTITPGHCSVPLVFCHPSQMLRAFPGDFAKPCIAQFLLCKNIANIFFVCSQREVGRGVWEQLPILGAPVSGMVLDGLSRASGRAGAAPPAPGFRCPRCKHGSLIPLHIRALTPCLCPCLCEVPSAARL